MRAKGLNKQRCELPGCNAVVGLDVDGTIYRLVPRLIGGEEIAHVGRFCCPEHAEAVLSRCRHARAEAGARSFESGTRGNLDSPPPKEESSSN